jgi:hypothetical protein
VISTISSQIGSLFNDRISFLNIASHLDELSEAAKLKIAPVMAQYGINLDNFYFESINVPPDDPSYIRLKQIKEKSAEINVVGRDIYQLDKSIDVLKTAAGNEGMAGLMMQSGMGAGMGMMMGAQLGQQAGTLMTHLPPSAPPLPPSFQYFVVVNGQQTGPYVTDILKQMTANGTFSSKSLVWRQGIAGWQPAESVSELQPLFVPEGPPPVPPYIPPGT